jgi:hypothetical protein
MMEIVDEPHIRQFTWAGPVQPGLGQIQPTIGMQIGPDRERRMWTIVAINTDANPTTITVEEVVKP